MFPFTREGRQTLIYLSFAGAGPALSGIQIWAMLQAMRAGQWKVFSDLAMVNAAGQFLVVLALTAFVSIRAIKIGKGGLEMDGTQGEVG